MSEEEIKKQYANGIVDIDKLVGSLIDKFKTDKTSVDIQQLQLVAEYLIYKADKLQKENSINKDIIENKIKELEENLDDDMFRYETMAAINVLKELLESDIE